MSIIGSVREAFGEPDRPRGLGNGLPVVVNGNSEDTAYGMAALADECDRLAGMAPRTGRNSALNKAAHKMAQLVASGHLTEPTMAECFRVCDPEGFVVFKWSEVRVPILDVLRLAGRPPLFGHRTGKGTNTHWVTFRGGTD